MDLFRSPNKVRCGMLKGLSDASPWLALKISNPDRKIPARCKTVHKGQGLLTVLSLISSYDGTSCELSCVPGLISIFSSRQASDKSCVF